MGGPRSLIDADGQDGSTLANGLPHREGIPSVVFDPREPWRSQAGSGLESDSEGEAPDDFWRGSANPTSIASPRIRSDLADSSSRGHWYPRARCRQKTPQIVWQASTPATRCSAIYGHLVAAARSGCGTRTERPPPPQSRIFPTLRNGEVSPETATAGPHSCRPHPLTQPIDL